MTDDLDICPGPCNRAWEAAERNTYHTGEPHNIEPNPGQPIWCPNCRDQINDHLLALPDLVNKLAHGLNAPPADTGRITRSLANPSPSPTFDLADEACRWAVTHEVNLREHLHHPTPPRSTLRRAVAYLTGHLTALLNQDPDGIDFGMAVNNWHTRLTTATGGGPARHYRILRRTPAATPDIDTRATA